MESKDDAVEWASQVIKDAKRFSETLDAGVIPDLTDEGTATAFACICAAAGGTEIEEKAVELFSEQVMNAHLTLSLLKLVFEGAVKPTVKNGVLAFSKGVRFEGCVAGHDVSLYKDQENG